MGNSLSESKNIENFMKYFNGLVINTILSEINIYCPYCGKTSTEVSYDKYTVCQDEMCKMCPCCSFSSNYLLLFIDGNNTYYVPSQYTMSIIDTLKNLHEQNYTFDNFNHVNFDNEPNALFLVRRLIKEKALALINTKHKSKLVSTYCWKYLKNEV